MHTSKKPGRSVHAMPSHDAVCRVRTRGSRAFLGSCAPPAQAKGPTRSVALCRRRDSQFSRHSTKRRLSPAVRERVPLCTVSAAALLRLRAGEVALLLEDTRGSKYGEPACSALCRSPAPCCELSHQLLQSSVVRQLLLARALVDFRLRRPSALVVAALAYCFILVHPPIERIACW